MAALPSRGGSFGLTPRCRPHFGLNGPPGKGTEKSMDFQAKEFS